LLSSDRQRMNSCHIRTQKPKQDRAIKLASRGGFPRDENHVAWRRSLFLRHDVAKLCFLTYRKRCQSATKTSRQFVTSKTRTIPSRLRAKTFSNPKSRSASYAKQSNGSIPSSNNSVFTPTARVYSQAQTQLP